jgi:hypothetical protein
MDNPDKVAPASLGDVTVTGQHVAASLPAASWTMISLRP